MHLCQHVLVIDYVPATCQLTTVVSTPITCSLLLSGHLHCCELAVTGVWRWKRRGRGRAAPAVGRVWLLTGDAADYRAYSHGYRLQLNSSDRPTSERLSVRTRHFDFSYDVHGTM